MMTREDVYGLIDKERQYQDSTYQPDKVLTSGATRSQRDLDVTSHLTLLDYYVRSAQDAWTTMKTGDDIRALQQIAKVAAIAVRALERAGGSQRLLTSGLR
jgi:hypothetical protein